MCLFSSEGNDSEFDVLAFAFRHGDRGGDGGNDLAVVGLLDHRLRDGLLDGVCCLGFLGGQIME